MEKSTYVWLFHLVFTGTQLKLLSEPFLKKVRQRGGKYYQGHGWLFKEIWGLQCICHTCHCITKPRIPYSSSRYQVPPSLHQTKYTQVYRCLQGHRFEAPSRPAKKKAQVWAWGNRKHFAIPPLVSGISSEITSEERAQEIPYWWYITTQIWEVLLIRLTTVSWGKFASMNQKHYLDLGSGM